uniref:Uncharacterized protein n=1 Tax=Tetradesmus obliquus TaxID=3088 RepID=A0A383WFB7_TETOB|eukprot:jgi/Sobl393_1/7805/SZX76295.1
MLNPQFYNIASADTSRLQGASFCSSCVCAVGVANLLGFEAAGVLLQGQQLSALAAADYAAAVGAVSVLADTCSTVLGARLLESGSLTPAALVAFAGCSASSLQCAEQDRAAAAALAARQAARSAAQAAAGLSPTRLALVAAASAALSVLLVL